MNLKIHLYLFFCFITLSAKAQITDYKRNKLEIEAAGDYCSEDFHWSIAGNSLGQNPNVLSEVKWKNINGPGMGLDIKMNIWSHIFFKGNYHRTFIKSGHATDTDYTLDNRTDPAYHADLNSNEGHTYTYTTALGYEFKAGRALLIFPYAGYVKNYQELTLKDFNSDSDPTIKTLNSTYQANWSGPIVGLEANIQVLNRLSIRGIFNYKQLKYSACADWNMIDAFAHPVSFKHTANGYETEGRVQLNFRFTPVFAVFFRGNYSYANTGTGTDDLFLTDGRQMQSQLNGATRYGGGLGIGISLNL